MKIGNRNISRTSPPYVIAELGVNHDGSVERALEMVDAAAEAGADAVKLQLFRADLLMSRDAALAAYQKSAGEQDPLRMLRRLELSAEQMRPVVARARARGLHAIVTVFSVPLVPEAEAIGFDAYKTASPDIINRLLLGALARTGRPMIVSTGAAEREEVERAVGWLSGAWDRLAVLQCVSSYPTPAPRAAIGAMAALRDFCPGPVGYSDHTALVETGAVAVAAGACVLEKHLTYCKRAPGPDHRASLEPDEFARYVSLARGAHEMMGPPIKGVLEIEGDVRSVSRQSLVAARDLPAGHVLRESDLVVKRPGHGVPPWMLAEVVGRPLRRAVGCDRVLVDADVAEIERETAPVPRLRRVG